MTAQMWVELGQHQQSCESEQRKSTYTKDDGHVRNAERGRKILPQGRVHKLVIRHQMGSPENII